MSKSGKARPPEERQEIEAQQATHKAVGWLQVVIPGGHRRMMTRAEYEAWTRDTGEN